MAKSHLAGQAGSQSEKQGDREVGDGWRKRVGDHIGWNVMCVNMCVCCLMHQPTNDFAVRFNTLDE